MSLVLRAAVAERGVDLEIEVAAGETVALIGPNGAGKSTALALVAGTLRPSSGEVALDGRTLSGTRDWVPPHRRRVTTLGQDPVLFPHLTAAGNIRFALRSQGMTRSRAREESRRWLDELGIGALAGRRPSQLSGGQAQRVAIARALAADPRLLLLDEPMAALDVDVAPTLREQLRDFLAERTALIVSHDVLDVLTLADRVIVLDGGTVREQGPTAELLTRPRTAFAARFAGLNLVRGTWDGSRVALGGGEGISARCGLAPGAAVLAAFRPAGVRLVEDRGLRRTVQSLAPRGDLVRVQTEDLAADLPPQEVARRHLVPGTAVRLAAAAEDVTAYEA
ncbi:ABC transporter ATP-binding protein [Brachybacterium sp. J153]|uniref:ABC transporter ATP-binding protein n=1 Tax=Brachybacterium sp. J153 TaxID=3116488 RepID=UPI002E79D907|nr:ABC transporter ATP-binding protein [Brachybacterium sp. J153]MEE1617204.1 ABC transporter ATP-binding protein [Brachybacterium sp. J153]